MGESDQDFIINYRAPWSEEEKELLRSLFYEGKKETEIALILNRSISSIGFYKCQLGLKRTVFWTTNEVNELKRLYVTPNMTLDAIAEKLGKTKMAVKAKATKLGLSHSKNWQPIEIEALLNLAGTAPRKVIVKQYQKWAYEAGYAYRSWASIYEKLKSLKAPLRLSGAADWYGAEDIASAFGCAKDTVSHWFGSYRTELNPQPISNAGQGGLAVSRSRLRSFVLNHPEILDRYRITLDFVFLTDLLKYSYDKKE